jgi:type VI secretion system secreted protein Hcp
MLRQLSTATAALLMLLTAQQARAEHIYCSITGQRQGAIHGDRGLGGDAAQIPVRTLTEEIASPRDAATGQATGKRQHMPVTLVKSLDSASPQLFMAAVTNEILSSVRCTFYRDRGVGGVASPYFRLVLTNAGIADLKMAGDGATNGNELESVALTYQRIELTDLDTNTSALDDWASSY